MCTLSGINPVSILYSEGGGGLLEVWDGQPLQERNTKKGTIFFKKLKENMDLNDTVLTMG
jgi:hypothetical protein